MSIQTNRERQRLKVCLLVTFSSLEKMLCGRITKRYSDASFCVYTSFSLLYHSCLHCSLCVLSCYELYKNASTTSPIVLHRCVCVFIISFYLSICRFSAKSNLPKKKRFITYQATIKLKITPWIKNILKGKKTLKNVGQEEEYF